uniref:Uncharacterized protein n=2 Tax=unclassified bacterial viruses TaxID=12333 RepID=A0AAU6VZG7_9VIRU
MRSFKAEEFGKDYEYERAKREERKQTRKTRDQRKGRKGQWEPIPADE